MSGLDLSIIFPIEISGKSNKSVRREVNLKTTEKSILIFGSVSLSAVNNYDMI